MSNSVRNFGSMNTKARVAADLLQALAALSDTNVKSLQLNKKTCNHIGNQEKGHITSLSKILLKTEKRLRVVVFLGTHLFNML